MDVPDSKVVSIGAPAARQGQTNTKQTNKHQLAKLRRKKIQNNNKNGSAPGLNLHPQTTANSSALSPCMENTHDGASNLLALSTAPCCHTEDGGGAGMRTQDNPSPRRAGGINSGWVFFFFFLMNLYWLWMKTSNICPRRRLLPAVHVSQRWQMLLIKTN